MKRLLLSLILTSVLAGPVLAGDMPTVGASAPAPTQSSAIVTVVLTLLSTIVS